MQVQVWKQVQPPCSAFSSSGRFLAHVERGAALAPAPSQEATAHVPDRRWLVGNCYGTEVRLHMEQQNGVNINLSFSLNPEFTLSLQSPVHLRLNQLSKLLLVEICLGGRRKVLGVGDTGP